MPMLFYYQSYLEAVETGLQTFIHFVLWTVTDPILLVTSPWIYFGATLGDMNIDNWKYRLRCLRCSWLVCAGEVLVRQFVKVTTIYGALFVARLLFELPSLVDGLLPSSKILSPLLGDQIFLCCWRTILINQCWKRNRWKHHWNRQRRFNRAMTAGARRARFANTSFCKRVELEHRRREAEESAAEIAFAASVIAAECAKLDAYFEPLFQAELDRLSSLYESSMLAASDNTTHRIQTLLTNIDALTLVIV